MQCLNVLAILIRTQPSFESGWFLSFADDIIKLLKACGLLGEIVLMRKAGRERLSILRFVKENGSNQVS